MATQLLDPRIWVDKYHLSGDMNALELGYGAEPIDVTTFGDATRRRAGGLKAINLNAQGFWNGGTDAIDEILFNRIGLGDTIVSVGLEGGDEGDPAYLFRALNAQYTPGAPVGDMLRFGLNAQGARGEPLVRGYVMHNGTRTTSGVTGKIQVGPITTGQQMYAALHVLGPVPGTAPTLNVVLQSDPDASAGGEATRITFAQATAPTSEWKTLAGPITEQFWRVSYTIGGTGGPSFPFVVTLGIR